MRSAERLFQIILLLRKGRVYTARYMAEELGVSLRTIYRDIKILILSGVPIEGEAGVGYSLRRDFYLPPLMLTSDEIQALALGASLVQKSGDTGQRRAADQALIKIELVLPDHLKAVLHENIDAKQEINREIPESLIAKAASATALIGEGKGVLYG
jgi:predicted DNA-binding transcriptional regulator YafY